ncbi:helix-turn-helix transcriptional regulator [Longispora sp. NPDC051575]|uniref:helix-turn-helix domain-containing protein n=1 Tax=Longispora sp. NPDC051575 TaxID=3154943 RepID=UPI00343DE92A
MNTSDGAGSSVPRRQLGRRLRALREKSGLRADQVAETIDVSRQTLWRMENGDPSVKYGRSHIEALCRVYKVGEKATASFVALAAETKAKGWWHAYGDVIRDSFGLYFDLEAAASQFKWYEATFVPGLLQTPEYAAVVIGSMSGRSEEEIRRGVEVRMARQAILTRTTPQAPRLDIVISEAVVRCPVGGAALMAAQLRRINDVGHLPNVSIRVVPFAFGFHQGMQARDFTLLEFPRSHNGDSEPTTVYVGTFAGELYLDSPRAVGQYAEAFTDLASRALNAADSRVFLARAAEEFDQR